MHNIYLLEISLSSMNKNHFILTMGVIFFTLVLFTLIFITYPVQSLPGLYADQVPAISELSNPIPPPPNNSMGH